MHEVAQQMLNATEAELAALHRENQRLRALHREAAWYVQQYGDSRKDNQ